MTRIVTGANATELAKPGILACVMVDMDFASGHLYANDGIAQISYGGHVYLPVGQFGGIEVVEEDLEVIARPVKLTLSGVDSDLCSKAQTEIYQNRQVVIYLALCDQATGNLVAIPETIWEGRMDYMGIELGEHTGTITVNCEHRLRREPRIARYTDADQQNAYSGDGFFFFTTQIVGFTGQWGDEKASYAGPKGAIVGRGSVPAPPVYWPRRR